jgi:hypothetical protein
MKLENLSSIGSPELDSSMFRLCHNTNGHPAVNKAPRCFPSLTSCSVNEKKHCKSKISVFHLSAGGVVINLIFSSSMPDDKQYLDAAENLQFRQDVLIHRTASSIKRHPSPIELYPMEIPVPGLQECACMSMLCNQLILVQLDPHKAPIHISTCITVMHSYSISKSSVLHAGM